MYAPKIKKKLLSNPLKLSIYRIDNKGIIFYVNEVLIKKTCGNKSELIGKNHSILKHNETPKVIQKIITNNLTENKIYFSVNKNCSKNNHDFWSLNYYKPIYNNGYEVKMIKLPKRIKKVFIKLFNKLNKIEKNAGITTAQKFINGFFEYKNVTNFQEFIFNIYGIEYKKTAKYKDLASNKSSYHLQDLNLKYE
jgi:hypothetical protein